MSTLQVSRTIFQMLCDAYAASPDGLTDCRRVDCGRGVRWLIPAENGEPETFVDVVMDGDGRPFSFVLNIGAKVVIVSENVPLDEQTVAEVRSWLGRFGAVVA